MIIDRKNIPGFLIFILIIALYHYYVINYLEKQFFASLLPFEIVKRPRQKCNSLTFGLPQYKIPKGCSGFPSGHMEVITLITLFLHHHRYITIWYLMLFIVIVALQRCIFQYHTVLQVVAGFILGFIYFSLYVPFMKLQLPYTLLFMTMISIFWWLTYEVLHFLKKN